MSSKRTNLAVTFFVAVIGGVMPLIRNLFEVNGNFSEVASHNYLLLVLSLIGFFVAYQIVNNMSIEKDTNSYYLSILGVNFLWNMFVILVVSIVYAVVA